MTSSPDIQQPGDRGGTNLEFVTLKLRDMILSGAFQPGERIAEIPVSAQLGVSRTPVRLALNILEQEGLLTGASRRGFAVRA
ncbi:MAG: GntR family transcriptional regulator, partial [Rhodospirillales bacterium]